VIDVERRPKVCKDIGLGLPRLHVLTHESSNAGASRPWGIARRYPPQRNTMARSAPN